MIDKQTQDRAWAALTAEQRETARRVFADSFGDNAEFVLADLFDPHNLTSDAEPEEVLTVLRKKVQNMYAANERIKLDFPNSDTARASDHINHVLDSLFGSKCLPDELGHELGQTSVQVEESNAEPKFKIGDKVINHLTGKMDVVMGKAGKYHYSLQGCGYDVHEDYLELYTEPTQTNDNMEGKEHRNLSQETANCDNSEEKELNLCEILNKSEYLETEFYSPAFDAVTLSETREQDEEIVIMTSSDGVEYILKPNGSLAETSFGQCMLYPSRESYLKYPLDAKKAWMEFVEANKPKVELRLSYVIKEGALEGCGSFETLTFNSHEEAKQAAEAVKATLKQFHKKNQQ